MGAQSNWDVGVEDLKALLDAKADFRLIDVREAHEVEICSLGGELIPLASLPRDNINWYLPRARTRIMPGIGRAGAQR